METIKFAWSSLFLQTHLFIDFRLIIDLIDLIIKVAGSQITDWLERPVKYLGIFGYQWSDVQDRWQ